ncbi:hypothetical protein SPI_04001 [Niveomyces insectorum RCEF 264]|uniref:Uncharacterized protein n=1 Tax=Niveomyces insectorum RCEF 264 TaxID=1081102 RepID=A0A167VCG0_9HYPO|nr:hypothetical protein SPI_04001 [Niveomyces insectorum RCEF 264]
MARSFHQLPQPQQHFSKDSLHHGYETMPTSWNPKALHTENCYDPDGTCPRLSGPCCSCCEVDARMCMGPLPHREKSRSKSKSKNKHKHKGKCRDKNKEPHKDKHKYKDEECRGLTCKLRSLGFGRAGPHWCGGRNWGGKVWGLTRDPGDTEKRNWHMYFDPKVSKEEIKDICARRCPPKPPRHHCHHHHFPCQGLQCAHCNSMCTRDCFLPLQPQLTVPSAPVHHFPAPKNVPEQRGGGSNAGSSSGGSGDESSSGDSSGSKRGHDVGKNFGQNYPHGIRDHRSMSHGADTHRARDGGNGRPETRKNSGHGKNSGLPAKSNHHKPGIDGGEKGNTVKARSEGATAHGSKPTSGCSHMSGRDGGKVGSIQREQKQKREQENGKEKERQRERSGGGGGGRADAAPEPARRTHATWTVMYQGFRQRRDDMGCTRTGSWERTLPRVATEHEQQEQQHQHQQHAVSDAQVGSRGASSSFATDVAAHIDDGYLDRPARRCPLCQTSLCGNNGMLRHASSGSTTYATGFSTTVESNGNKDAHYESNGAPYAGFPVYGAGRGTGSGVDSGYNSVFDFQIPGP